MIKTNYKGFTLIELLAVITILSIILTIVIASVTSVLSNSKDKLQKTQEKQILKAAEIYNNKEGLSDFDSCVNVETLSEKGYLKENEIQNLKNGDKLDGSVKIYYNINRYTYEYDDNKCLCKSVSGEINDEIGTKYECEVKSEAMYNFYILSKNEDESVNLIMDRNICNDGTISYTSGNNYCRYKWYSSANNNTYGPTTVMAELYAGTKDWDNVEDMVMNYTDENNGSAEDKGYTSIITTNGVTTITGKPTTNTTTVGTSAKPLKARIPKESEVTGAGCTTSNGSCPTWLMEYMTYYNVSNDKYSMNNNSEAYQNKISGYWLLSSSPGNISNGARRVGWGGRVYSSRSTTIGDFGARPVITVSKSDLSK